MAFASDDEAKQKLHKGCLSVLETTATYMDLTYEEISGNYTKRHTYSKIKTHTLNQPNKKVGDAIMSFFGGFPIIQVNEVKHAWETFIEVRTPKLFYSLLGTIFTLIFGTFSILHWTFFVMTILHFITRHMANHFRNQDDYINFQRSIQLFFWPYLLLAGGNALSYIITINGFPEGSFFAALMCWLIWGEVKGFVENAKTAKLPIPPIIEEIVNKKQKGNTPL